MPGPQEVLEALRRIKYPGYTRDIVSFGMVKDVQVSSSGTAVHLAPSTADEAVVRQIEEAVRAAVVAMPGVAGPVTVIREAAPQPQARRGPQPIPGVASVLAVASGKGGVGKSTVATNLALALGTLGQRVGLLDADVYGPSVPLMLGIEEKARPAEGSRLVPAEKHGLRVMSMGMFLGDRTPVIWRGPMVTKLITEFLRNVVWGELDTLVRAVREAGDRGLPLVAADPAHPASRTFREVAERILVRLAAAKESAAEPRGLDVLT